MINQERLTNLFAELASINGPSRAERRVADFVKSKLVSMGLEVEEDQAAGPVGGDAGNVIALLKGNRPGCPAIFFNCHMDTIEPTEGLNITSRDGVLASDGKTILGADDRAGIAEIIEAVQSILEDGTTHGDVQIVLTVSEEVGLLGARHLDPASIVGCYGFVFDSQKPPGGIVVSAPSHETISARIHGKAAHAGMAPETGVSAIVAASRAISSMELGRIDEETTANIGVIEGGKARNIIPDLVVLKGEARSRNEQKLMDQVAHMRRILQERAEAMGASVEFEHVREYSSYRWTEQDDIIRLASAACARIGMEPTFQDGGGGSDANIFNSAGIPTVVIGAGYDNAHTSRECIAVSDLVMAARYAESLIETAASWENQPC